MAETLVVLAGIGQLLVALTSIALPSVLDWRRQLAAVEPLTRAVFWTYAGYICGTNLALGLLALLAPHWLLAPDGLARAVAGYAALYWGARLVIQFTSYHRHAPRGAFYRLAEAGFTLVFAYLTVVFVALAAGWR